MKNVLRRRHSKTLSRIVVLCATLATACASPPASHPPGPDFVEAVDSGIDFTHFNGMTGQMYPAEIMGPGGALFDYDNDGDLDIYLPQGRLVDPRKKLSDAVFPPHGPLGDRLYRNDTALDAQGKPLLRFVDVSKEAGLGLPAGYTMGVATGDYDSDGFVDLYLTQMGPNQLLRNNGDGTFTDTTLETGTGDGRLSIPAAFFDYDRDGHLDLWVGNYVDFRVAKHKKCVSPTGRRDYCGPLAYDPLPDRLFRNRGDGTFEDVTDLAGMGRSRSNALGVIVADFDLDGWLDLYVANDTAENYLWGNRGDGTFEERALLSGCALNADGEPEGSMGVDAADVDSDGDEDIFMTHMSQETNTLYLNEGGGSFEDATIRSGLGRPSWGSTGFGTAWLDYDNDGRLDLIVGNGEIKTIPALDRVRDPFPLHQPNQLYRNMGGLRFEDVSGLSPDVFGVSEVTRGLAVGDIDNDGDSDVLIVNNNGPARILVNQLDGSAHWLGVRLVEGDPVRDALGARVALQFSDGSVSWRRVRVSGSYASAQDPRILFGLGGAAAPVRLRVHWNDGSVETWEAPALDRYSTIARGSGVLVAVP